MTAKNELPRGIVTLTREVFLNGAFETGLYTLKCMDWNFDGRESYDSTLAVGGEELGELDVYKIGEESVTAILVEPVSLRNGRTATLRGTIPYNVAGTVEPPQGVISLEIAKPSALSTIYSVEGNVLILHGDILKDPIGTVTLPRVFPDTFKKNGLEVDHGIRGLYEAMRFRSIVRKVAQSTRSVIPGPR